MIRKPGRVLEVVYKLHEAAERGRNQAIQGVERVARRLLGQDVCEPPTLADELEERGALVSDLRRERCDLRDAFSIESDERSPCHLGVPRRRRVDLWCLDVRIHDGEMPPGVVQRERCRRDEVAPCVPPVNQGLEKTTLGLR